MNFRSDNTATVAAEILTALSAVNDSPAPAYGEDPWSRQLDEAFSDVFEHEVRVFTVATGTAANSISLASLTPPWGAVLCHREAHIECDECGAPEFYSGGAKLVLIDGAAAKITPDALKEAIGRNARGVHSVKPAALSMALCTAAELLASARKPAAASRIITWSSVRAKFMLPLSSPRKRGSRAFCH